MLISLCSCKNKETKSSDQETNYIIVDLNENYKENIFNIIEELDVNQLSKKGNSNFTFYPIVKTVIVKDNFYFKNKNDGIYLVKKDGDLIKSFSAKGFGPNEYRLLSDFDVNTISEELFIYDFAKQRFLVYDLFLNYKRTENIGFNFVSFKFIKNDIALFTGKHRNNLNNTFLDYDLLVVNKSFDLKATSIPFDYKKFETTRLHLSNPFNSYRNHFIFNDLISDTIYKLSKNSIKPFKHFKYKNGTFNKNLKLDSHKILLNEINEKPEKFNELDFFAHLKSANNNNIIYNFSHGGRQSIYSFTNFKNSNVKNYEFPLIYNNSDHKSIFEIQTSTDEKFISIVYPHVLKFIKDQYLEKFTKEDNLTRKIDAILENTFPDGNQIILKFKIKDF